MSDFDLDQIRELLPAYLGKQRWFAGSEPEKVEIEQDDQLHDRLLWLLVEADNARYQVLVGACSTSAPPDFLHGHDAAILGASNNALLYDATLDPELTRVVLDLVAPGVEAKHVRPMGAEQSNTSLVFDERFVLKVFRRIHEGANPDIEVTAALGGVGFDHVAAPVGVWERDQRHLAVVQPFLAGASDGWALALTSLRDYYGSDCEEPSECGGDFAAEAQRLGQVTAAMHASLARAFGTRPPDVGSWVGVMLRQLERVGAEQPWRQQAEKAFQRFAAQTDHGQSIRVHGDYHLGQVVRTDAGWYVLDFEGEPARPLDERRRPASPLKDVAGMLRSLQYATAVARRERGDDQNSEPIEVKARLWEERNRNKFLTGYFGSEGVSELLPGKAEDVEAALAVWELDKAVYEVGYELGHRPDWVAIPESAVLRILEVA